MEKCHVDAGTLDALRADFKAGKHPYNAAPAIHPVHGACDCRTDRERSGGRHKIKAGDRTPDFRPKGMWRASGCAFCKS